MKKITLLSSVLMLALLGITANAQQLPNVGFENWKTTCDKTTWTSTMSGADFVRPGVEPMDWNGSSVDAFYIKMQTCTKAAGDNGSCVNLKNFYQSLANQTVPSYMTVGTPWVFVGGTGMMDAPKWKNAGDGGSYGGVAFTDRPDAVSLKYWKKTSEETSRVIAYFWAGTFKSKVTTSVSGKDPNFTYAYEREMDDVDRAVMGVSDLNVTQYGKLIASVDYPLTAATTGWTDLVADIRYDGTNGALVPEKMNVVISAADYWTRANLNKNTELLVDDVKFLYYSRLSSLTVNGTAVEGFASDKYSYTVNAKMPQNEAVAYELLGGSPAKSVSMTRDEAAKTISITVTNTTEGDAADADGAKSHTYILQFLAPETTEYTGYLNVEMLGTFVAANTAAAVQIADYHDGTCDFMLPDLTLPGLGNLGTIAVPDVTVAEDDFGVKTYTGSVTGMALLEGAIMADVDLNGTIDKAGKVAMDVAVVWVDANIPISVAFTSDMQVEKADGYYYVVKGDDYAHPLAEKVPTVLTVCPVSGDDGAIGYTLTVDGVKFTEAGADVDYGNLTVAGLTMTPDETDGSKAYDGTVEGVALGNGETATVAVDGGCDVNAIYKDLKFAVTAGGVTHNVVFNTEAVGAGVEEGGVEEGGVAVYAVDGGVAVKGMAGNVAVYAADGRLVKAAAVDGDAVIALQNGLYVVRADSVAVKVVVK